MKLYRHSEPYSPDGNLSAEGFENLLGTPSLDLLAVLVREALQNICDATRPAVGTARACIRIRVLSDSQRSVLRESVFSQLPDERTAATHLETIFRNQEPLHVLEIADYGTSGLAGPSRADIPPQRGENPDFVNFFRNIGAVRDVQGGGGTYGYGKATLYRASRAHAIVVDTLTTDRGHLVRRFMAAQMGRAVPGRFTGRHWWGVRSKDGQTAEPVTGNDAERLARLLGLPSRVGAPDGLGTTIVILAPHLPGTMEEVVGALQEQILWYFWPRLMADAPPGKRLEAEVACEENGWKSVPRPEEFPPLNLLCRAMRAIGGGGQGDVEVYPIASKRPRRTLGRLAIMRGQAGMRRWLLPPAQNEELKNGSALASIIPERLCHVALMRPARFVVRYEKGGEEIDPEREWGGVFICSEDEEVETAFARSEPPAHDDWQPESLPSRSREKTFVNVALRRIRELMAGGANPPTPPPGSDMPLARPSTILGTLLPGRQGEGAGVGRLGQGKRGGSGRRKPFTQPRPRGLLADESGDRIAEFEFEIHDCGKDVSLEAEPLVAIDGGLAKPDQDVGHPRVLAWVRPDGSEIPGGGMLEPDQIGTWRARVSIPGEFAVALRLDIKN